MDWQEIIRIQTNAIEPIGKPTLFKRLDDARATRDSLDKMDLDTSIIKKPIIILGLARSGTSFLHGLLSSIDGFRAPTFSECRWPLNPNHEEGAAVADLINAFAPDLRAKHNIEGDTPEECRILLEPAYTTWAYTFEFGLWDYGRMIDRHADWGEAWNIVKRLLTVLDNGDRWVLKEVMNLTSAKEIKETFPDATIVWCQRDPVECVASAASLCETLLQTTMGPDQMTPPHLIGYELLEKARRNIAAMSEFLKGENVYNVYYDELIGNPIDTASTILEGAEADLDSSDLLALKTYVEENPQYKYGPHEYSLERYGLTPEEVYTALEV